MSNSLQARLEKNKWHRFQRHQTETFLSLLKTNKYQKISDIGCGSGYWDYCLVKENLVTQGIYGCDIFDNFQKEEIQSLNPGINVDFKHIKGSKLPFSDNEFDLVFSMDVIEHIEDDCGFLAEHIRIAKPGGAVLIGTPNYWRTANIILKLIGKLKYPREIGEDVSGKAVHLREYTKENLIALLSDFNGQIKQSSVKIVPCWCGIMGLNVGFNKFPKPFEQFCQFWFVKFNL